MEVMQPELSQFALEIGDPSHIGEARRQAVRLGEALNLGANDCGAIAIAVTELGTNALKHAKGGRIVCGPIVHNGVQGLCVLSIDAGPGIQDISKALEDGYSTSGTSGNGLGAVRRLATLFDVYSIPGRGTCVLAEFWPQRKTPNPAGEFHLGVISVCLRGETVCGDGWAVRPAANHTFLMVVDGLGHGRFAAEAAREAERVFAETKASSPAAILNDCHDALRKTRGAAAAVASISKEKGTLAYAGLGNISSTLICGETRRGIASHNGTIGHQMHRLQEFTLPWEPESVLIMHSDGLASRWDLSHYPGIARRHPGMMAAVLYRDFNRERDDVTVLVARNSG